MRSDCKSERTGYLGGQVVDGEYDLGYIGTPYLPVFPCVHVALDGDFWTFQPQTGYIAKNGTLKVQSNFKLHIILTRHWLWIFL